MGSRHSHEGAFKYSHLYSLHIPSLNVSFGQCLQIYTAVPVETSSLVNDGGLLKLKSLVISCYRQESLLLFLLFEISVMPFQNGR